METLPDHLKAVRPPIDVNEARCYTVDELRELTGLSVEFWRGEIAEGRIRSVRFGRGSRNDRVRVSHTVLVEYIRARTEG